jgi:hypothetical protein
MSSGVHVCRRLAGTTVCGAILLAALAAAQYRQSAANFSGVVRRTGL